MNKVFKNIIIAIGLIFIISVIVLNIVYIAEIKNKFTEHIEIKYYGIINLVISLIMSIGIYSLSKINIKNEGKWKYLPKIITICSIIIYLLFQIVWINFIDMHPNADQLYVYNVSNSMYLNEEIDESLLNYLELYPQQLTLASIWSSLFKLLHCSSVKIIQYGNAVFNVISIVALCLITKCLGKKYNINKNMPILFGMLFMTVPLLSTFVYGDEPGMATALLSFYFIMKYGQENKRRYLIISAICMAFSYMFRMNNLILIIASCVYLVLDVLKEKVKLKDLLVKISFIFVFITIALLPGETIKLLLQNKYDLDMKKKFPAIGYIYMGMTYNGGSAEGWYNGQAYCWAVQDIDNANEQYIKGIEERLTYFKNNPKECANFYKRKVASMWTENTYGALWYNFDLGCGEKSIPKNGKILEVEEKFEIYQKAVVILIFWGTLLIIVKKRKDISNEIILLLVAFIGGFLFHIIWEAKSRYIISYIYVLIPIASINWKMKNVEEANKKNIEGKNK